MLTWALDDLDDLTIEAQRLGTRSCDAQSILCVPFLSELQMNVKIKNALR